MRLVLVRINKSVINFNFTYSLLKADEAPASLLVATVSGVSRTRLSSILWLAVLRW